MSNRGIGVAAQDFAEIGGSQVEIGLLKVRKSGIDARHVVRGIRGQDLLELGQTFFRTSAVDEHEAEIVAGVEVAGREGDGAAIGFDSGNAVSGPLASEPELIPGLGGFWIECRGGGKVGKGGRKLRCRVQRLAEVETVVEGFGV